MIQDDIRDLSMHTGRLLFRAWSLIGRIRCLSAEADFKTSLSFRGSCRLVLEAISYCGVNVVEPLAFLTIGVIGVAAIMSASRGVFMWCGGSAIVMITGFLWGAPWRQGEVLRIIRAIQRSILVAGLGLFAILALFPDAVASRFAIYAETLSPSSTASELLVRTRDYPLSNFLCTFDYPNWPYGYGIGTASLGVQYVVRIFHATPMRIGVENGFGQIILELGIVGLLLWIALGVSISISSWKVAKQP